MAGSCLSTRAMKNISTTKTGLKMYTEMEKRQAILSYIVTGNSKAASKETGIPASTIREWKQQDWWDEKMQSVRDEADDILDGKFNEILHTTANQLKDRIEKGDYVMVGSKKVRKPVSARDLATVGGITFDKLRLLRNQPTSIKADAQQSVLNKISDRLKELADGGRIIDGETILSDGSRLVTSDDNDSHAN